MSYHVSVGTIVGSANTAVVTWTNSIGISIGTVEVHSPANNSVWSDDEFEPDDGGLEFAYCTAQLLRDASPVEPWQVGQIRVRKNGSSQSAIWTFESFIRPGESSEGIPPDRATGDHAEKPVSVSTSHASVGFVRRILARRDQNSGYILFDIDYVKKPDVPVADENIPAEGKHFAAGAGQSTMDAFQLQLILSSFSGQHPLMVFPQVNGVTPEGHLKVQSLDTAFDMKYLPPARFPTK